MNVSDSVIAVIDERLNGYGRVIDEAAEGAGLDLALACALVEQESGGRNVFGCDHGDVGDRPPYCHQEVTRSRVRKLRDRGNYGYGTNGVGLTQLTWYAPVEKAEALGGAHLPMNQCRVGFGLLADYLERPGWSTLEALGAYNAGETDRKTGVDNGYASSLAGKWDAWKALFETASAAWPEVDLEPDESGWLKDAKTGEFARTPSVANGTVNTNKNGWLWVPARPAKWEWPYAWDAPVPDSASYAERNPTRYSWSYWGRDDVDAWARAVVDAYPGRAWVNTYHHHPEQVWLENGVSREADSMDVWGPGGRGDPIDPPLGDEVFAWLFNDPNPPNIEWIIWRAAMYGAWNGWKGEPFGTDDFSWHYDHVHVTYRRD